MAYEPKVGDEVVVKATILDITAGSVRVEYRDGGIGWRKKSLADPVPDAGEAEMRGEVTGPWAVALSEAMEKVEKRVAELEASAKVRDVPATMVNLASRVQGLEVTVKTMMEDAREKDARVAAELDGVLVRVGRLEEFAKPRASFVEKFPAADAAPPVAQTITGDKSARASTEDPVNVKWTADTGQFMWLPRGRNPNIEPHYKMYTWRTDPAPAPNKSRGHGSWAAAADEIRDAQGRVLKSKMQDVDPQADWSTARPENAAFVGHLEGARSNADYITTTIPYLQNLIVENTTLRKDIRRAEARVDSLQHVLPTRGDPSRSEFHRGWAACTDMALASLKADPYKGPLAQKDPAHGAHAQASE